MKITVFGSGYVGLVTGACLADVGNDVLCVDVDLGKIEKLRNGIVPIYEPGLGAMIETNRANGNLDFTIDAAKGVAHGDVLFIAVGTPPDEDGSADLRYVMAVAQTIGSHMGEYKLVVNKSTVPVGTADAVGSEIKKQLMARNCSIAFDVCSNPEFLKEGAAIDDFTKATRIVIGAETPRALELMRELYAPYNRNHDKIIAMDIRSAELTKYAANAMLATKISLMNELANIAERIGADIEHVRIGIGSDPRIGYHFIYPGCGYGGSCFPKDIRALAHSATSLGLDAGVLAAVELVNENQKRSLFAKISDAFPEGLAGKTIAVWGLAFKPNTDDMREAPSRPLMESLWAAGAQVRAFDPKAMDECRRIYGDRVDLVLCGTATDALRGSDALVICTEWKAFRTVEPALFTHTLTHPIVVDGRNIYDPSRMRSAGIIYYSVGRQTVRPSS